MSYSLEFVKPALKEWKELDQSLRNYFKKKLIARLETPRAESARISGMADCYKIKLRQAGYRLVYKVEDETVVVFSIICWQKRTQCGLQRDGKAYLAKKYFPNHR